jgi:hypothetical protein
MVLFLSNLSIALWSGGGGNKGEGKEREEMCKKENKKVRGEEKKERT